jgi:NTP pyrophosphatase (non-canonical NTP hydrolase)
MMAGKGLVKLMEECGELTQIAAKKLAFMETDNHPDGNGSMNMRLQEEIADVLATCTFVIMKFDLDLKFIAKRSSIKVDTFTNWDAEE